MRQLALITLLTLGCGGGGGGISMGRCLTDAEICQFKKGVSTKQDVMSKLGNAQQYLGPDDWAYTCTQFDGQMLIHNDLVSFTFDDAGVLSSITVLRQGSGSTVPPSCSS